MLADPMLKEVNCSKFLGILFDKGNVDLECPHLHSKLSSGMYVLRSLDRHCLHQVLVTAYYSFIYNEANTNGICHMRSDVWGLESTLLCISKCAKCVMMSIHRSGAFL